MTARYAGRTCSARGAGVRGERGQTMVIVAVLLVALVAFLALVVDVGNIYAQRRMMQNAADAGALAGARALAEGKDEVGAREVISTYTVLRNGAQSYEASFEHNPPLPTSRVVVTAYITAHTFFAGVIGWPEMRVPAVAAAEARRIVYGCVMPLTVQDGSWEGHGLFTIWDSPPRDPEPYTGNIFPPQRGWLNLDDGWSGADDIKDCITQGGYQGPLCPEGWPDSGECWKTGEQGTKRKGLEGLLKLLVDSGYEGFYMTVPVYDVAEDLGGNKLRFRIVGFVEFFVTDVQETANPKYVQGRFVDYVTDCGSTGGSGDTEDFGLRRIVLVDPG